MDTIDSPAKPQSPEFGSKVRSAMLWNAASMVLTQVALSAIFIVMADRLAPEIFGVFGFTAVFIDLFAIQGIACFIDTIVQRQDFSRRTMSTVFWVAMAIMSLVTVTLIALAPLLATLVKTSDMSRSDIIAVLSVMALSLMLNPLGIASHAIMRQQLDFRGVAIRGVIASLAGALVALAVAFTSAAEWALVVQRYVGSIVAITIMLMHTRQVPTFEFDRASGPGLAASAGRIFAAQGIAGSVSRVVDLVVGALFGAAILGCLRVASKLQDVLVSALVNPIGQLWVVLIAQNREEDASRRKVYIELSRITALICLPGFLGVALTSRELTALLFKPEFAPVGDMLAILCGLGIFVPLINPRNSILTSMNRLNMLLWMSALDMAVVVVGMLLVKDLDWRWVILATGLPNIVILLFLQRYVARIMATPMLEYARALLPPYLAAAAMIVAVASLSSLSAGLEPWQGLILKAAVGASVYCGFLMLFFRPWTLDVVTSLSKTKAA